MDLDKEYKKYRWFFTSGSNLVVGGKSAENNDALLKEIKKSGKEYWIMHTSHPGSPFCVILADVDKVSKKELAECAIFCGCFSRAWKEKKKKTEVHLFKASEISKPKGSKVGTWRVNSDVKKKEVELKLVLTKQKNILRAVPEDSVKKKDILLTICPGKIDKKNMLVKLQLEINEDLNSEEIMSALPAGGIRVCK